MSGPDLLLWLPGVFATIGVVSLALSGSVRTARVVGYGSAALASAAGAWGALSVLTESASVSARLPSPLPGLDIVLRVDPLSAYFLLILALVSTPVSIAAIGYARAYDAHGGGRLVALYCGFVAAMCLTLVAGDIYSFLFAWELMSLAGYGLVIHEHDHANVRRAGFVYLTMAHLGAAFVASGLFSVAAASGETSLAGLTDGLRSLNPLARHLVVAALLIGLITKAGGAPMHAWLPRAHPVAPAHVSALLSGVMVKTAIYGFLRLVVLPGGDELAWVGWATLVIGALSALVGALYAAIERDVKGLLAFSTIENVGLILLGVGVAIVARTAGVGVATSLAIAAALFHTLGHALVKSLLFLAAGAVDQAAHTRDIDRLGGLNRTMPWTGALFLIGALTIAGLPPLALFGAEWMLLQSIIALGTAGGFLVLVAWICAVAVALTGGLAVAAFARAFAIAFLGAPRSPGASNAVEAPRAMRAALVMLAILVLGIGLLPNPVTAIAAPAVAVLGFPTLVALDRPVFGLSVPSLEVQPILAMILALAAAACAALLLRLAGPVARRVGPLWVCGFDASVRMQYTGTAAAETTRLFFRRFLRTERVVKPIWGRAPFFPAALRTHSHTPSLIEAALYVPTVSLVRRIASEIRVVQSGSIRLYLLYMFATLVILLALAR